MGERIDIVLLAGFLGAGKTTVLNELIRQFQGIKLGMLVNDFGEVPVDGALLKSENPEIFEEGHKIYEIGNGSIFCSCLKAPFLYGLQYFEKEKPEILFVEASGLSDPSSMDKILKDHGLDGAFRVKRVLTLVDPVRYVQLVNVLDVISRQIMAADNLLINKADLVTEKELKRVEGMVRELNREVPIQKGFFGQFDYSFLGKEERVHRMADRESCNTPDTRPASLFLEGVLLNKKVLLDFLGSIKDEVYRLKGFWELEGGMHYVSDTGRGFCITPVEKCGIKPGLTVLCPPVNAETVQAAWQRFREDRFRLVGGSGLNGGLGLH